MRVYKVEQDQVKQFMGQLLLSDLFGEWFLLQGEIRIFCNFSIDGRMNADWEESAHDYVQWGRIKPYLVQIIKGKKTPEHMKLVLLKKDESGTGYLNISYEGQRVLLTTTYQSNEFMLDHSIEEEFCQKTEEFFQTNQIAATLVQ